MGRDRVTTDKNTNKEFQQELSRLSKEILILLLFFLPFFFLVRERELHACTPGPSLPFHSDL